MTTTPTVAKAITNFDQGTAFRNHPLIASAHAAGENRNTFEAFVRGFIADLQPVGTVEATLAARAAGLAWRLNRAQQLETQFLTKRDSGGKTPLEVALTHYKQRDHVEAVSRWEQSLERSLLRTLDALRTTQRLRQRRGNTDDSSEPAAKCAGAIANECETLPKGIAFDGEALCDQHPETPPKSASEREFTLAGVAPCLVDFGKSEARNGRQRKR